MAGVPHLFEVVAVQKRPACAKEHNTYTTQAMPGLTVSCEYQPADNNADDDDVFILFCNNSQEVLAAMKAEGVMTRMASEKGFIKNFQMSRVTFSFTCQRLFTSLRSEWSRKVEAALKRMSGVSD